MSATLTLRERALAAHTAEVEHVERARIEREEREHREWVERQRAITERAIGTLDWFPITYEYDANTGLIQVDDLTVQAVNTQRGHDLLVLIPRCSCCGALDTGVSNDLDEWSLASLEKLGRLLAALDDDPYVCPPCRYRGVPS